MNRSDIVDQNLAFVYGRDRDQELRDPDKIKHVKVKSMYSSDAILAFEGNYAGLAPGFLCPVCLPGDHSPFPSYEHALAASKVLTNVDEMRQRIRGMSSIREAKKFASIHSNDNQNWKDVCVSIAENLVRDKFVRNKELRNLLLSTKDKSLVYGNDVGETFWGVGGKDNKGQNRYGLLLEKIRNEIECGTDLDHWLDMHFKSIHASMVAIQISVEQNGAVVKEKCRNFVNSPRLFLGKDTNNDIVLNHPSVSRIHAVIIVCDNKKSYLVDLRSSNGTFLNEVSLQPFFPYEISSSQLKAKFAESGLLYSFVIDTNYLETQNRLLKAKFATEDILAEIEKSHKVDGSIFVSNISYSCTESNLREFFRTCGNVASIHFIKSKESRESNAGHSNIHDDKDSSIKNHNGSAIITFENSESVMQALSKDGEHMLDRVIHVRRYRANPKNQSKNIDSSSKSYLKSYDSQDDRKTLSDSRRDHQDPEQSHSEHHRRSHKRSSRSHSRSPSRSRRSRSRSRSRTRRRT